MPSNVFSQRRSSNQSPGANHPARRVSGRRLVAEFSTWVRALSLVSYGVCVACSRPDPTPKNTEPKDTRPQETGKRALPSASVTLAPSPSGAPGARPAEPAGPYNVILIMVDSLRADMPWTGYPRDIAPWLTNYQKQCTTYTQGYALSSYTAKSVAPALVGEYPSAMVRDGMFFTRYPDADNLFIGERAQAAGHFTLSGQAHGYFLPALGNNQGFDDYRMISGGVDIQAVKSVTGDRLTALAKTMLADPKLDSLPETKRFFAYFHYMDPHHTYERHREHPDFGNKPRDLYDNEVHYTDQLLGTLIDWTRTRPWANRTAIIITADHGEGFGEHNHFRHAYELWESLIKVPLILCVPQAPPRTIAMRRSHIDLAPTIADLMQLPEKPGFRGTSLRAEIFGGEPKTKIVIADLPRSDLMDRRRALIDERGYKIIAFGDDRSFELYNLSLDPNETKDLSESEPQEFERMKQLYARESQKIPVVPIVGPAKLKGAPAGRRF